MNELVGVAVQVPALAIMGVVFLYVLKIVLETMGQKIDRIASAVEKLAEKER